LPLQKIVILGGGTAGWMCAAAMSRITRRGLLDVTLVESEQIGTVGVGEATIPPIMDFNRLLEINEAEFLAQTQGSFKLGIQFRNWGRLGDKYFHPFGAYGYAFDGVAFHQIWQMRRNAGDPRPLEVFSLACMAADAGKFMITGANHRPDLPPMNYAYHFDAARYARFLRTYAEARGVIRKEGTVSNVEVDPESGSVASIQLQDGSRLSADLFVDCSGFRGVLIEQTMQTGYEDWGHWLPCDRAVALPSKKTGPVTPYTISTAHSAGWQWRIPLQHRTGNGHVYCSSFISDDHALDTLKSNLDGEVIAEPNFLKFRTGRRRKFWNKNVVALGLAGGFMEPLESTSIHLIQTAISKLVSLLSTGDLSPYQAEAFNRLTNKEFERIRDFLILHYNATTRTDSDFWNYCRTMQIPDSLSEKIELYRSNGQVFREDDELFTSTSWVAVLKGQGIEPRFVNPMASTFPEQELTYEVGEIERSIRYMTDRMPTHEDFILKYCPAPSIQAA
jgi:tryptophan halogenase